ncbi:class I SAM-dependent methyltransferase [Macrococcoides caseolyticum]|uniref:Class I SAM-dependent methyltransferase n=1 Tax=Macrococcoides caseolyticum TaxID=69966 RepID=A0ACC9MU73_9STAP|nr:class I SAM-dependent methyltransferase [Macrococcus caseolyticus]ARQ04492.1 Magnesium-protoporphyrin O-methyltransferase [Macrococcus caseolyticus]PKD98117.1 class I SAM-dependent methyltransferase [Macrococcus caseolyticus]PKE20254.1 class I SAM-dependent methyltransferase [Macrococcus caseolyticus]PKE35020.1 class I SAM-dependent methyltransferase [Macrococcus caseolyticus]PKE40111.1 class I SAM-dependent methyltransferase [Macrococcus caseolyticus]
MSKNNFYDSEGLFNEFKSIRENEVNFNDLVEKPILFSMLPDLNDKSVLDIGCGMGQHVKQYADMGAKSVLGIDISEKLLSIAEEKFNGENIEYQKKSFEDIDSINQQFDVVTSSLVFDYVQDFDQLMKDISQITHDSSEIIFSMSHPIVTAYDRSIPRWTRDEDGNKLYANLYNYFIEGEKHFPWGGTEVVNYHRTISSIINSIIHAGFTILECKESLADEQLRKAHPEVFAGTIHRPDFIFFKCIKM